MSVFLFCLDLVYLSFGLGSLSISFQLSEHTFWYVQADAKANAEAQAAANQTEVVFCLFVCFVLILSICLSVSVLSLSLFSCLNTHSGTSRRIARQTRKLEQQPTKPRLFFVCFSVLS